jgi:hypothetical protein
MWKPISPRVHGIIDYTTSAATAAAPMVLGLPPRAKVAAQVLAGGVGGMASMTKYPLGLKPVIPFKAHGIADKLLALAIPALPWMLGVGRNKAACNFFLGLAAVSVVVTALTDWEGEE